MVPISYDSTTLPKLLGTLELNVFPQSFAMRPSRYLALLGYIVQNFLGSFGGTGTAQLGKPITIIAPQGSGANGTIVIDLAAVLNATTDFDINDLPNTATYNFDKNDHPGISGAITYNPRQALEQTALMASGQGPPVFGDCDSCLEWCIGLSWFAPAWLM
jgi:hypothetical protein